MLVLLVLDVVLWAVTAYEVVHAFNCGSQTILNSPMLRFTSDQMYEGLTSYSLTKPSLPSKYIDPVDMELLSTERTTDAGSFSYLLRLKGSDHYLLLFKFIEGAGMAARERVFEVRVGDELMHEVDIAGEVGNGQVLHKWVEFELRDDILYVNGSTPLLNAYIYPKQLMKVTFSRVKERPKVEALVLIKGQDASKFLHSYLQLENSKNENFREYTSEKYHRSNIPAYRHIRSTQDFDFEEQTVAYYIGQLFSLRTLVSVLVVLYVLFHQQIYERLPVLRQEKKEKEE